MKIKKNGKVISLSEADLQRIVKRTLNEGEILVPSIQDTMEMVSDKKAFLEGKYKIVMNGNKVQLFLNGSEVNLVDTVKQMR